MILTPAASVMYQRLRLLRNASSNEMDVNFETLEISEAYLAVINALSCVPEKNAWIFVSKPDTESPVAKKVKREGKGPFVRRLPLTFRDWDATCTLVTRYKNGICPRIGTTANYPWKGGR